MSAYDEIQAMYARHPISAQHILAKLGEGSHAPEALWAHDQDHYGGLAANERLAGAVGMKPGMKVADFCAGLGGPARWYAHVKGVDVTGVDLSPDRVAGAAALSDIVGLGDRVKVLEGSITNAPLPDAAFDAVVSQEAFMHVPDKAGALAEAFRVLSAGGRLALTDVTAPAPLSDEDAELLCRGLMFNSVVSSEAYVAAFESAGFADVALTDLSAEWTEILQVRLRMYMALREETSAAGTPAGDEWFHRAYPRFVELISDGALGGAMIVGEKP
ncbi:MAG: methyltransferase domain-containing protein [Pseudomonadota bacterium]